MEMQRMNRCFNLVAGLSSLVKSIINTIEATSTISTIDAARPTLIIIDRQIERQTERQIGTYTHTYILSEPIKLVCLKGCRQSYVVQKRKITALTTLSSCSPVSHPCIMKRKTERM